MFSKIWKWFKFYVKFSIVFILVIFGIVFVMLLSDDGIQKKIDDRTQKYNPSKIIDNIQKQEKEILEQNKKALEILKNN